MNRDTNRPRGDVRSTRDGHRQFRQPPTPPGSGPRKTGGGGRWFLLIFCVVVVVATLIALKSGLVR